MKGWSSRASGRISPFSFSSQWGQQPPQPRSQGPEKIKIPSSAARCAWDPFIVFMTLNRDKGKQLEQEAVPGCLQMGKPKKRWKRNMVGFWTSPASSNSPTPTPALNPSIVSKPQIPHFAWKSREEPWLKYTSEFFLGGGCMGMPKTFTKAFIQLNK